MSTPQHQGTGRRALWWIVGAAIVIAVVLVVALALGRGPTGSGSSSTPGPSGSSSGANSGASNPPASSAPTPPVALPELSPVPPTESVTTEGGLAIKILSAEAVKGDAVLPGEIAGPAVRYTIQITNAGADAVDLANTSVTCYTGGQRTPMNSLTSPGAQPFSGSLAKGASGSGVYVFSVPAAARDDVTIIVDYGAGQPAVVFQGAAPAA